MTNKGDCGGKAVKSKTQFGKDGPVFYDGEWETRVIRGAGIGGEHDYCFGEVQIIDGKVVYWEVYENAFSPIRDFKNIALWMMAAIGKPMVDSGTLEELGCVSDLFETHDRPVKQSAGD